MADTQGDETLDGFDPFAGPAILRTAPTTGSQREIWTASHLGADASLCYNESITLRFDGEADIAALEASFARVLGRHDALRSTISADGLSVVVGDTPAELAKHHDLSSLSEDEQAAAFGLLLEAEVETPFDLAQGPLVRLHLVRFGPAQVRAVLTAHHIVFDGWSTAVLIEEWAAFYREATDGEPAALEPAQSFCDYALDELAYVDSAEHEADRQYWLDQYRGTIPTLELPNDRARPRQRKFESRRVDMTLPPELVQAVRKAGAAQGASLFTTLLAGFDALLHRLSAHEDIVVGIPAAGQSVAGWQSLVGHCVNVLPLRATTTPDLPFAELVRSLRTTMLDAYDHQRLTFGSLVAELPITRDPSRPPLVSVIFNVDRGLPSEAIDFSGLTTSLSTNERHFENFDVFLNAVELPDGLVLECQYNSSLFDETTIRRWLAAYERLLVAAAHEPATSLAALPLTSVADREQIDAWNAAALVDHSDDTFVSMFEAQVADRPDDVAVVFEGTEVTYAELDTQAEWLAAELRRTGVGVGQLVGLSVERSERMLIGLVGILKSGAGYVPLDPGFPRERLDHMVTEAGLAALVTERSTHDELGLVAPTVILLDDQPAIAPAGAVPASSPAGPDDTAYVIFTSGSTGTPKGVQVPHRALSNLLHSVARTPGMDAADTVLAVTTLSFDIAVSELLLPLTVGATIALASRETAADGGELLALLRSSGATFIDATPATYRLLFAAGFEGDPNLTVICTGEAMPMELGQRLVGCVGSLWNGYGPTETTVWSSFHRVERDADRVLIGFPVDNTQLYVLDDHLEPTPIGVPGELYIAGRGLTDGYFGRPDLTAERFVPDPFGEPGALMYRSGDLARYMADGQLECLGRNDHQVKIRGYRIELGEIEHVLDRHDGVSQSVVAVREDTPGDPRLVAYLLDNDAVDVGESELRAHLGQSLPDYMVPRVYCRLAAFPLTPSGKVDRTALPAPGLPTSDRSDSLIGPRTETEAIVADLFQEALAVPRVSVDDDFFSLGGHSLLASQVLARLRQDHDVTLSFRVIFEAPTVESLAARVEELQGAADTTPALSIERRIESGDVDLSVSQERLWLLEQMDPSQELVHNLPAAWRLHGPVDLDVLQRALDEVVRRHGTLRTRLLDIDGSVRQRIEPTASLPIERIDLRTVPAEQREAELGRVMNERTRLRFDLFELPLYRSYLIQVDDEEFVYHTVRHNLIWDGWSFDIFLNEMTTLYGAFLRGEPSPLEPLPATYADYVGFQRSFLESDRVAEQIAFWQERLAGDHVEATLPPDRSRPATSGHAGENLVAHLGRERADALTRLGREHGATLYMVLFAAFNVVLHRYSRARELLVGTPVRARQIPEVEGIIGPFINAVVLRTTVDPNMTFAALLDHVREVTLDSFSHEDMPLELLGTRPPVVRTFFSFQDARTRPPTLGDTPVEQLHAEPPAAANDLMLWMMETPTDLLAVANYSTELYDAATIEAILDGFDRLLGAVIADPDTALVDLPVGPSAPTITGAATSEHRDDPITPMLDALGDTATTAGGLARRLSDGAGPLVVHATTVEGRLAGALAALAVGRSFAWAPADGPAQLAIDQAHLIGATSIVADHDGASDLEQVSLTQTAAPLAQASIGADQTAWYPTDALPISRTHLATLVEAMVEALGLDASSRIGLAVAPGSDLELLVSLAAHRAGAAVRMLGARDRLDREASFSLLIAAPSQLQRYRDEELATVDHVGVAGSPTPALLARLMGSGRSVSRIQMLGSSEPTVLVAELDDPHHDLVAGRPLAPAAVQVVRPDGSPASVGVPGQIMLAPASMIDPGAPFVATGAIGRLRSDGRLERLDEPVGVVDIDGRSVRAAPIEEHLAAHPAISRAQVDRVISPSGADRLTAYIETAAGEAFTATELRRHVRDAMPTSLTPATFVEVDEWVTTPGGRLDVSGFDDDDDELPYLAPRSDAERLLAEVWATDLGVDRVGIHDNFFALGGHSLLCFRVLDQIESRTGARLSPRVMLLGSLEQTAVELDAALSVASATDSADLAERSGGLLRRIKDRSGGS